MVLTGRETLPPRSEWTGGLNGVTASVKAKIEAVLDFLFIGHTRAVNHAADRSERLFYLAQFLSHPGFIS
jgi:hypothetical protein